MKIFFLLFSLLLSFSLFAQQHEWGIPLSESTFQNRIKNYVTLPSFLFQKKLAEVQSVSSKLKKLEFAHVFETDFSPANNGEWTTTSKGEKIWRLGLVSSGAYSLNLIFTRFYIQPGIRLYVYSPQLNNLLGAYTSNNNTASGMLAIQPLPGDSMVVEMDIPKGMVDFGEITIGKIGHDYMNILGSGLKNSSEIEFSGSCNLDINCTAGLNWQLDKHAVCKMIINAKDLCTGTLINNTSGDKTPYLITANHCIDTATAAQTAIFIFNYEKWKCKGIDGPVPLTLSGSQLIATTKYLDFSLVKLGGLPSYAYKPYFIGWDRSGLPPANSVCLHHPNGDFKKISADYDAATLSSFPGDYNPHTHWLISKWDLGTTEKGSSGAPLIDQNHHLIGDLTGGDANCTASVNDYFARFSNSWADFPNQSNQLKHWLDPLNTNEISINGLDPYETEKSSCDTIWNIASTEKRRLFNTNLTWGYLSGQNSSLITQFAEKIDQVGSLKIPGFYLHIAKDYYASPLSYITVKLWKDGPVPGNEITSRSFYLKDFIVDQENYLEFDSIIYTTGPVFIGYSVNYSATQDTFALYQAEDRGATGSSSMFVYMGIDWKNISEVTSPAIHSALAIGLISCDLINGIHSTVLPTLKLYPNPVSDGNLVVELPLSEKANVKVFSVLGKQMKGRFELNDTTLKLDVSSLLPGIYLLEVVYPGKGIYTSKFMVEK
jgi:lysyl endopeptidase